MSHLWTVETGIARAFGHSKQRATLVRRELAAVGLAISFWARCPNFVRFAPCKASIRTSRPSSGSARRDPFNTKGGLSSRTAFGQKRQGTRAAPFKFACCFGRNAERAQGAEVVRQTVERPARIGEALSPEIALTSFLRSLPAGIAVVRTAFTTLLSAANNVHGSLRPKPESAVGAIQAPFAAMRGARSRRKPADRNFSTSSALVQAPRRRCGKVAVSFERKWRTGMHGIIYLVGLVVVVMAILSFLGLG